MVRTGVLSFRSEGIFAIIGGPLQDLSARLIRSHAPRSVATISSELDMTGMVFESTLPLRKVKKNGNIVITDATPTPGGAKVHEQTLLILCIQSRASARLAPNLPGFEIKERFFFGFFLLPFLWLRYLPFGKKLLARIFSFEVRFHPYLNLLTGLGMVTVLARRHKDKVAMEVSCVIPAYNEALRLPAYLGQVKKYFKSQRISHEIIVVDDGSRDDTANLVEKNFPGVNVLRLYENFGKGAAVREGIMHAQGRQVLISDADGATPIAEFQKLHNTMIADSADIAIGSRYLAQSEIGRRQSLIRRLVSRAGNFLIRLLLDLPYKDTQCGFKLMERRAAQYLFRNLANLRFGFDFEILKKAAVLHLNVAEVPVEWHDQDGSKVTFRQTLRVLSELIRLRFGHLFKFTFIGVVNTIVDFSIHNALIWGFGNADGTRQLVYMVVAFLCANIVAFCLHSGFTFQRRAAYRRFFIVSVFTLSLAALLFYGLNLLYNPDNSILLTNLFKLSTVIVSFITNYFGYKFWVYRYAI